MVLRRLLDDLLEFGRVHLPQLEGVVHPTGNDTSTREIEVLRKIRERKREEIHFQIKPSSEAMTANVIGQAVLITGSSVHVSLLKVDTGRCLTHST